MWSYEKRLQFPVRIKTPNAAAAKVIITQYGGPDGELGASMRYLSQRYTMPWRGVAGLLTDIGTEELAHLEMIAAIVHQLTRNLSAEELEAQRKAREEAQERLRSEIYTKLPRVAAIDRELRRTITQIIAASLRDGSDPVPAIGVIRDKNLSLQAEKAALLTEHGYPADALDDKPACPKCSDTGWVGANMCACLKALCTEEQIRELSKLLDLGEQSFDSFSLDYYSPLPWPGESLSPRENMEFIFDVCSSYARKFGRFYFRNLFLTGAPGLGKTFLSACIARTVSESGFSVVYDTAVNIFTRFEEQKFARDRLEAGEAKDETRRYLGCDLLILDDLGSELSTPFVQSALYTLINTRLTADKRTVISSNLTMDQVRARYTPQIASRLEGEYRVLPFYGEDIRLLRKQTL